MSGSLFNYSPQSDGTLADVADINTPFSQVSSVLNGGIGTVNIAAKALDGSVLADSANPEVRQRRTLANYVVSGLTIATSATLSSTVLAGTAYINGKEVLPAAFPKSFTASKDTYVDLKDDGTYAFVEVVNNAPSGMTLALNTDGSNAMRIAKVVTSATAVTGVFQSTFTAGWYGIDFIGNQVYNRSPNPTVIGLGVLTSTFSTTSTTPLQITSLSAPVVTPVTGRNLKITAYCGSLYSATGQARLHLTLWDGPVNTGTQLNYAAPATSAASTPQTVSVVAYVSPAGGLSKVYNLSAHTEIGANACVLESSVSQPVYITVEIV